jgi:group II intron reverse transcriptase/maturase
MIREVLAWENLVDAWNDVRARHGAPGIDGVSVDRWGRTWEERLVNLRRQVLANTYRPAPLKRYDVPKTSGGYRHITCLTVTDKVLQRAVLNVLDARLDPLFLPCSYGYRKGRSTADAVEAICIWRDAGYRWVLDADIDECFDSLDHAVILDRLRARVSDAILLRLVEGWLQVGRRDPDRALGIPLGAVISPLLCNLTLHELDVALTRAGYRPIRYADDFVVLCRTEREARQAEQVSAKALARLRLRLEPQKTAVVPFRQGFDYLGVHFEGDAYQYVWANKRITVEGDFPDFLFAYGPEYE